jgi:hypothetical protein
MPQVFYRAIVKSCGPEFGQLATVTNLDLQISLGILEKI